MKRYFSAGAEKIVVKEKLLVRGQTELDLHR